MRERNYRQAFSILIALAVILSAASSDVFAQPKDPQNFKNYNPSDPANKELNDAYYNKQIADATDAINSKPGEIGGYYRRGEAYVGLKKYEEALRDFDKAHEIDKNSDWFYMWRGYVYYLTEKLDVSIKDFDKALEINPKNEYVLETRETVRTKFDEQVTLIKNLDNLIAEKPNNPRFYADRAKSYGRIGKQKEAEADLEKSRRLEAILKKVVSAECASTDYDCQIEIYDEQIKITLDTDFLINIYSLYSGRAAAYYRQGNLDEALADLNKVIDKVITITLAGKIYRELKPQPNARDYYYRGKILFRQGKYDEALGDFNRSVNRKMPNGYADIGDIYRIKRDYDKALANYEEAIESNRRNAQAYFGRAMIYLKRGTDFRELENDEAKAVEAYNKAVKDFDSVIEIDLANAGAEVYLQRARAYEKLGETEKAAADRAKAEEFAGQP